jgi:(2S)-methylsuccinyl-CoA dehydrogenase
MQAKTLTMPVDSTSSLDSAKKTLESINNFVSLGLRNLKVICTVNQRLEAKLLDDYQFASYQLAFCTAEISAASYFLDYCRDGSTNSNQRALALLFAGDTFQSVIERLKTTSHDIGIDSEDLSTIENSTEAKALLLETQPKAVSALGAEIVDGTIGRLPSGLDDEKELVRESFSRFADEVVAPLAEKIHREDRDIPDEIIQTAAQLGCFGTCIPERFGGLQPDEKSDSVSMIVVTEELSRGSLGAAGSLITRPEIAARALLAGGTERQQQNWLPKLASGETLCAISITEPNTGSDVAAVSLKATAEGNGWILNGSKTWCTFAGRSELIVTLARTNQDNSLGHKGLSMFLIEKPAFSGHQFEHCQVGGGKLSGKSIATLGYRGMHSFDLFFEDYFVPNENLVGENEGVGKGFYYTMAGFSGGRIQTAARATGLMQAAFDKAVTYSVERKVFEKSLGDFQLTQIKLARMLATITACRQFSYAVADLLDKGQGQMEASLVKLLSCRAAEWLTREAMQIHGGMGYAEESAVSRYFVDARVLSIFEGAEEVLALKVVARELIEKA